MDFVQTSGQRSLLSIVILYSCSVSGPFHLGKLKMTPQLGSCCNKSAFGTWEVFLISSGWHHCLLTMQKGRNLEFPCFLVFWSLWISGSWGAVIGWVGHMGFPFMPPEEHTSKQKNDGLRCLMPYLMNCTWSDMLQCLFQTLWSIPKSCRIYWIKTQSWFMWLPISAWAHPQGNSSGACLFRNSISRGMETGQALGAFGLKDFEHTEAPIGRCGLVRSDVWCFWRVAMQVAVTVAIRWISDVPWLAMAFRTYLLGVRVQRNVPSLPKWLSSASCKSCCLCVKSGMKERQGDWRTVRKGGTERNLCMSQTNSSTLLSGNLLPALSLASMPFSSTCAMATSRLFSDTRNIESH